MSSTSYETAMFGNGFTPKPLPVEQERSGRRYYDVTKRVLDICVALAVLVVAAPVMLVVATLVKLTSPGPLIFKHRRLGLHGKPFMCWKFRTMVADAEEQLRKREDLRKQFEETYKIKDDPRLTSIGAFLRKSSLDELPQLLNVLRGEISLIGPRPIVESEQVKYGAQVEKLLLVKPGLSGLWQVRGRSNTTYEQRIKMDMEYIDERSIWLDLKLMYQTIFVVLNRCGAY